MVRWRAFADVVFAGSSARLAFARALEEAETDAAELHPEAWMFEDHRITFALQAETPKSVVEGTKRLLSGLVLSAVEGEVFIEVEEPWGRWARKAAVPSVSKEILIGAIPEIEQEAAELEEAPDTIRTTA